MSIVSYHMGWHRGMGSFYFQSYYPCGGWWASGVHSDLGRCEGRITLVMDFTSEEYRREGWECRWRSGQGFPPRINSVWNGMVQNSSRPYSVLNSVSKYQYGVHGNSPPTSHAQLNPLHSPLHSSHRQGTDQKHRIDVVDMKTPFHTMPNRSVSITGMFSSRVDG